MIRDHFIAGLRDPLDVALARLNKGRFRPALSWDDAAQATFGYERFPSRSIELGNTEPLRRLTASQVQLVAAMAIGLEATHERSVRVLDFGGAHGGHQRLIDMVFCERTWDWTVCETPAVVRRYGRRSGSTNLRWAIEEQVGGSHHLGIASASLQYVIEPTETLAWMMSRCNVVILNRTPLWPIEEDRVSRQMIDGKAAYPAWFLSEDLLRRRVRAAGASILAEWHCPDDQAYFAGHRCQYSGMVIRSNA